MITFISMVGVVVIGDHLRKSVKFIFCNRWTFILSTPRQIRQMLSVHVISYVSARETWQTYNCLTPQAKVMAVWFRRPFVD